ncbi:unannotated protein [freshwater metagenome]|uniref:DNA repair protein RecN n=1 Tax=freshwater metagenome TaxID=449393 RepID=A0A6J5ZSD3_9ZZZZ|nr:DNA repair protein RecN [Actinomycetota bacterium]MSV64519.1 DNA repair protein RecN [Actinomycetota bacterium]MSW26714.1 DNA repair protein RecN [Actinomycetota bacterium]MSW34467.1 DNA repair protein RecN [Actinomycetota bacterium]MSX31385.1 DNA repair protein RecN [Actinomycetota bacterium]
MSDRSYLEEITIRGIGVIEEASLELGPGFNVLTGETGAGKTMILTALSLVLGGKSDANLVRQGSPRLVANATFKIDENVSEIINETGGVVEDGHVILTRTLSADGKSKGSIGGVGVAASVLAQVSESLIEIHAQAANMSITKAPKQREILDRFGGEEVALAHCSYSEIYSAYHSLRSRISEVRTSLSSRAEEIANLTEFAQSFAKLKPAVGEFSALENEIIRLSSVEEFRMAMETGTQFLDDEESGILTLLSLARKKLEVVGAKDVDIAKIAESLSESFYLLEDATREAHSYLNSLEADPLRLDQAQNRRADLSVFIKRFGKTGAPDEQIAELIARSTAVSETIDDLSGGDERLAQLEAQLQGLAKELESASRKLSKTRSVVAAGLSRQVSEEIHSLAMPHTQFICQVESPDYSQSIPADTFTVTGADEVLMLLQSHQDGPKVAVAKGASGGEMSRVMLALEVVLAQSQPVGTYVFDEVDAGVGGKAAIDVGRRLHELSRHAQVIVVTHLPQVAAWADTHFVVRRSGDGSVNQSDVENIVGERRVEEIARMLAGLEDSKSAQEHAAELLAMRG